MIRVNVKGIAYDISGNPIILLTDVEEERVLPIWVGLLEAHAIAVALGHVAVPRPLTHDLLKSTCEALGARISQVVITDLKESTFYAEVHLALPQQGVVLDARPSDAVALALRAAAPVFLADKLNDQMLLLKDLFDEETRAELEKLFKTDLMQEYKKSLH
ncbi:MAG: bifunctional nuclease family protein [Thermoanaerobacteraceae bacterium]|nr:bifunctional nuclease family protein [Thermoanaerobacteraceae bacterium]